MGGCNLELDYLLVKEIEESEQAPVYSLSEGTGAGGTFSGRAASWF